jgi:hypothetical protein
MEDAELNAAAASRDTRFATLAASRAPWPGPEEAVAVQGCSPAG